MTPGGQAAKSSGDTALSRLRGGEWLLEFPGSLPGSLRVSPRVSTRGDGLAGAAGIGDPLCRKTSGPQGSPSTFATGYDPAPLGIAPRRQPRPAHGPASALVAGHDGTDSGSPTVALNVPAEPGARGRPWARHRRMGTQGSDLPRLRPAGRDRESREGDVGAAPDASPTDVPEEFLPAAGPGLPLRPSRSHSSPRL